MHSLLLALTTAPAPAPSPSLRPGLSQDQVTPGLLGFLLTAFIVVLTTLLIVDMVRRIRRVRYRAQVEEERAAAEANRQPEAGSSPDVVGQSEAGSAAEAGTDDARNSPESGDSAGTRPEANGPAGPGSR